MPQVTSGAPNGNEVALDLAPITDEELIDDRSLEDPADDKFRLGDFVADLAERCRVTPTPANIALYGAWGSGKSSLGNLLKAEFRSDPIVAFGRFDAFKYAEVPLRRHFLSQVAASFKITDEKFSDGLYSSTETKHFNLTKKNLWEAGAALIVAAIFVSFMAGLAALVIALIAKSVKSFDATFVAALRASIPGIVLATPIIGALLAIAFERFNITITRSAPSSEEQFEKLFIELVGEIKKETKRSRVVIFIDELDRCSPKQVGSALETIRTFLDVEPCIFIVAADQQVLEHALNEGGARQATPADLTNPYYSSGSAYLDKIFHHQLPLPPLLPRRLSQFAYNLIEGRPGVWQRVPNLSDLVSVLIPTHVRSPRRVKALLNTFASLYRIALRRAAAGTLDPNVASRASEVAKLVCLQAEFPLFARELALDDRLPEVVLAIVAKPDLTHDFLDVPGVSQEVFNKAKQFATGQLPVADLLTRENERPRTQEEDPDAGDALEEANTPEAVQAAYGQQLLRYLERTHTIPGPRRDLIFLDSSGAAFDLPAELADRLERDAVDGRAADVAGAIQPLAAPEQLNALRLLARLVVEGAVGIETANVMRSLFAALDAATTDLAPAADDILSAFNNFSGSYDLASSDLPGALRLSFASDGAAARSVRESVLARDEIMTDHDLGMIALEHAQALRNRSDRLSEVLAARIADSTAQRIVEALKNAPDDLVISLIGRLQPPEEPEPEPAPAAATAAAAAPEDKPDLEATFATALRELADALLERGRKDCAAAAFDRLLALDTKPGRDEARKIIERFAPISLVTRVQLILGVLKRRYPNDWPDWLQPIATGTLDTQVPEESAAVGQALSELWRYRWSSTGEPTTAGHLQAAASELARISKSLPLSGEGLNVTALLEVPPHPVTTEAEATLRSEQHDALFALAGLSFLPLETVARAILADAETTLGAPEPAAPDPIVTWIFYAANRALQNADAASIESFIGSLDASDWIGLSDLNPIKLLASSALRDRVPDTVSPLDSSEIAELLAGGSEQADTAVSAWVEKFKPNATDLVVALRPTADVRPLSPAMQSGIAVLAGEWDAREKANLLDELGSPFVEDETNDRLLNALRVGGADPDRAVATLLRLFTNAKKNEHRTRVLRLWGIAQPPGSKAQRKLVDDVFIPLIGGGKGQIALALDHFGLIANVGGPTRTKIKKALDAAALREPELQKRINKALQHAAWIKRSRKWHPF